MSWVFLAGERVYKLKKPVVTDVLDFGTIESRRRCCEEEVRLNQRLARGVYLRVARLTCEQGKLALDGPGEIVDWLVVMKRLPAERMLDAQIASRALRLADLRRLCEALAVFYRAAPRAPLSPRQYRRRLRRDVAEHCRPLEAAGTLVAPQGLLAAVREALLGFLGERREQIEERVRAGHVIEGHGDLRPEHVCLLEEPVVIDCLEFNPKLRWVDAVDELAYLAMECERLRADHVGAELLATYSRFTGDVPPPALADFYASLRAVLRAKLALAHLPDEAPVAASPWVRRARAYLRLASRHAAALRGGSGGQARTAVQPVDRRGEQAGDR